MSKHAARKQARREAHALRQDNRRPADAEKLSVARRRAKAERREAQVAS